MNSGWKPGQKKSKGKASADLDNALGDLLGDDDSLSLDSPKPKKVSAKASFGGKGKTSGRDDDFYSSLAADADYSELSISEADPNEMAKSLAGFDDMEADLFGSKKATPGKKNATNPMGRTSSPQRNSTPPKGALRPSTAPESTVKKTVTFSPPQTPTKKAESSELKPTSRNSNVKGEVRAKVEKKKIDFGEMDEDDPLAGLLSDDEEEFGIRKKTPKKSTLKSSATVEAPKAEKPPSPRVEVVEEKKEAGPRSRMLDVDRPPTRSGPKLDEFAEVATAPAPVKKPVSRRKEAEITFDDDDDDVLGDMLGIEEKVQEKSADTPAENVVDKPADGHWMTYSNGKWLGFDDEAPKSRKKTPEEEENKPAKSIMDSLLGKSTDVSKHLERPGSGAVTKKEFVLDKKYTQKEEKPKESTEEDFLFGSYRPSSAPSRSAGQGRRGPVLDEDLDDMFGSGSDRPTTRLGELSATMDAPTSRGGMSGTVDGPSRRGMSATVDGSEDWLSKALKDSDADAKPKKETTKAKAAASEPGDWLGLGEEKGKEEKDPGDWLGFGSTKAETKADPSDYLGLGSAPSAPQPKRGDDWLALGEEKEVTVPQQKVDPKAAVQPEPSEQTTADLPSMPPYSPPHGPGSGGQRRNRMAEIGDLFSTTTAASDMSSTGSRRGGRRRLGSDMRTGSLDLGDSRPPTAEFGVDLGLNSGPKVAQAQPSVVMPDTGVTAQLREMEQQQAALKMKQEELLRKQQQEQLALQKKMQEEQILAQQKQRQVMEMQLQQQQAKIEEESMRLQQQMMQTSSVGYGPMTFGTPLMSSSMMVTSQVEMEGQVKKSELEKEFLQSMLDTIKKRHQEEIEALEQSNKSRIQMMEESFQRREARLREDNDHLVSQNLSKVREMEQERTNLISANHRKLQEWEKDKADEMERIKDIHRKGINDLRKEHEEGMERLRMARDHEIQAVTNVQSHSKSLQNVMDKIEYQARNLGDLHQKVEGQHGSNLDDRERVMHEKDTHLKVLEDRLRKQQEDNNHERTRLQELITKMEMQLREQTRQLDAERWNVKQEQNKLEGLQIQVDEEKRILADQAARDRKEMQKSKDSLLSEQRTIMAQLYEERRALAEERTEFVIQQKLWMEKKEKESVMMMQVTAERDGTLRTLADERAQTASRSAEVKKEEERIAAIVNTLEKEQRGVEEEKRRIQDFAVQLKKRSEEIEEMGLSAARARDEGQEALIAARKTEAEQNARLQNIQTQLQALRNKEKQMAQERLSLSKDKRDVENARKSVLCMNCRTPVRDTGAGPSDQAMLQPVHVQAWPKQPLQDPPNEWPEQPIPRHLNGWYSQPIHLGQNKHLETDLAAIHAYHSTPHPMTVQSTTKGQVISATIELDKNYRLWQIDAERDKDFLDDETAFLEALKHTPYHKSMKAL
ncbi:fas-binding factor 1-like isoform X2 [Lineus longissimus]|uniref:fas-binding factor 1-like isoform X2 n=1 Tax=Lineus longissimus TaxID=88925 RepID=UPI00315D9AD4